MDAAQLHAFAERYTAAWCTQDPARVAACFAPQSSLRVNAAAPAVGRDAITEVARGFMSAFPDMQVLMDDVRPATSGEGTRAMYHWTLVGTNTGPGGTGKRVRISGYEEWELAADGRIAASLGHFDEDEYQRQLQHGFK